MIKTAFLLCVSLFSVSLAGRECVWVLGKVECQRDPTKNLNVEIRVWDRDGPGPLQLIDPDDLMGVTFSNDDGRFQLDGCGDDFDWIPGVKNVPEPYIEVRHYCNDEKGEMFQLPEFSTFVPNTYDIGTIVLDKETRGTKTTAKVDPTH
uniref:Transthyretin-like protein 52 n=2 Tax=Caenorhabditis japonica TaxID=281687 RepID=A0A8R1I343_CAEJA